MALFKAVSIRYNLGIMMIPVAVIINKSKIRLTQITRHFLERDREKKPPLDAFLLGGICSDLCLDGSSALIYCFPAIVHAMHQVYY